MRSIEDTPSQPFHLPRSRSNVAELLSPAIADALAALQDESCANLGSTLRWQCLEAVERLWQRRDALTRALALPPRRSAAPGLANGDITHAALMAEELEKALASLAPRLFDTSKVEREDLRLEARGRLAAEGGAPPQATWPPAANTCAAALRWIVERASNDHAVRVELMQLGMQLLVPRLIELCRRQPAAQEPLAQVVLIESVQPGQWFRMYLHDQWTAARLTWLSDNGRFFMFSSRLGGRSHSLSRPALERLIVRGQIKRLVRGLDMADRAAGGHEAAPHAGAST